MKIKAETIGMWLGITLALAILLYGMFVTYQLQAQLNPY